jgi:hypothetical protein
MNKAKRPSTNAGMAQTISASVVSEVSQKLYCLSAEYTPRGIPRSSMRTAATASWSVTGAASQIIWPISRPLYKDAPRSPCRSRSTYFMYWT